MINLTKIKEALESIEPIDGDASAEYIDAAIENLKTAVSAMNTIGVRGKDNLDKLLGCIMGIGILIGEDKDGR